MAKPVLFQGISGRTATFDDGATVEIPEGVSIVEKTEPSHPRCWHLGNEETSTRVVVTIGDTDDNVRFRLHKVTPKKE